MRKKTFLLALLIAHMASVCAADDEEAIMDPSTPIAQQARFFSDEKLLAAADNLGPTAEGFSNEGQPGPDDEDYVDPRVLRDFIEGKGMIQTRQKEGSLTIAGDVRARWIAAGEEVNGIKQRGQETETAIDRFKSEINLYLDYVAPRTWVSTKLTFVNFSGRDGGTATRTDMERAFIGFDIFESGKEDFYIEIGRSDLSYIVDSKIQFSSIFDGIHLFYTNYWPCVGQFTIHGGPFIMDSFTNHYAWVIEAYVNKFMCTNFSLKYSIVDWYRFAPTLDYGNLRHAGNIEVEDNPRYRFVVSQWLVGYEREINFCRCKTFFAYGAFVYNWAARPTRQTLDRKLPVGWYAGFTLGKLCKACDWSFDINYQYVQAQAVPEFDLSGMGHGNAENGFLSDAILIGLSPNVLRLFTNYQGWQANLLYAMTDSLSLRTKAQYAFPATFGIGGDFRYKSFEMSVIYAF